MSSTKRPLSIALATLTLFLLSFTVTAAFSSPAYAAGESCKLVYDQSKIDSVGKQAAKSQACCCYAGAYAKTIATGSVHYWGEFDTNGGSSQQGAFAKSMTDIFTYSAQNGLQNSLKACYDAIKAGRSVMVYVKQTNGDQHWVLLVGYTDVTNANSLSMSNFLMLDPVNGASKSPEKFNLRGYSFGSHNWNGSLRICKTAVPTTKSDPTPKPYTIQNYGDDFYAFIIRTVGWTHLTTDGSNVFKASKNDSYDPKQIWHFLRQSDGSYKIINEYNDYLLNVDDAKNANGANINIWKDNGNTAERWFIISYSGTIMLKSALGEKALDTGGTNGNVHLWDIANIDNQNLNIYKLTQDGVNFSRVSPKASNPYAIAGSNGNAKISWVDAAPTTKYDNRTYELTVVDPNDNVAYSEAGITGLSREVSLPSGDYTAYVKARNTKYSNLATEKTCHFSTSAGLRKPAEIPDGRYKIHSTRDADFVWDVQGGTDTSGTSIIIFRGKQGAENQEFTFTKNSDGTYTIAPNSAGLALDNAGDTKCYNNGANLIQFRAHGDDNQRWYIEENYDGSYSFRNKLTNLYINLAANEAANSVNLHCWEPHDGMNARFTLERLDADPSDPGTGDNEPISVESAEVTPDSSSYTYTGFPIEPRVVVRLDDMIIYSENYDVTYKNNVNPGTATVTITAKSDSRYEGTATATFEIEADSIAHATVTKVEDKYAFRKGTPIEPLPTVTLDDKTLVYGRDYAIRYENNSQPGTATLTITGVNGYKGTVTLSYQIECEHSWGEAIVTHPATCTEYGISESTCTECGEIESNVVEPAHKAVAINDVAATCTAPGLTAGERCSICQEEITPQKTVPALDHDWNGTETVKATCTEAGHSGTSTCSRCGAATQGEVIPALGHDFGVTVDEAVAPTCTKDGSDALMGCSRCDATQGGSVVKAAGHEAEELPEVPATCTSPGLTAGSRCAVCGAELVKQEAIPTSGHVEAEGYDCDSTYHRILCETCGKTLQSGKHRYGSWTMVREPSGNETGLRERTCSICDYTDVVEVVSLAASPVIDGYSYSWTGEPIKPKVTLLFVYDDGSVKFVTPDSKHVVYSNNVNVGTASAVISDPALESPVTVEFSIVKAEGSASFAKASVAKTYGAAAFTNAATVLGDGSRTWSSSDSSVAAVASDGTVALRGAGKATITLEVAGTANCSGSTASYDLTVAKASQSAAKVKTSTLTFKGLKRGKLGKTQSAKLASSGVKGKAKVTWKIYSISKAAKKHVTVSSSGTLTAKKGLKKGTYSVKVKMSIAATSGYNAKSVYKTVKVVIK